MFDSVILNGSRRVLDINYGTKYEILDDIDLPPYYVVKEG
jgi:hypothetical protein